MIVASNAIDRFVASLRIFGTLIASAVLIAGMNTALTGSRSTASCGPGAVKAPGPSTVITQH
jgi:hypothetical protein